MKILFAINNYFNTFLNTIKQNAKLWKTTKLFERQYYAAFRELEESNKLNGLYVTI